MSKERKRLKEIMKVSIPSFDDIITSITKPVPDVEIFLFNPISRALHQLPFLSTVQSYYPLSWNSHNEGYNTSSIIYRIKVSSMDTSECVVAAVLQRWDDFVVVSCSPRDKQWRIFPGKDDKEGYTNLDILFSKGSLHVSRIIPHLNDGINFEFLNDNFGMMTKALWDAYLVESTNGELLFICRSFDTFGSTYDENLETFYVEYQKTKAFEVFKIDPNTGNQSRLQSLGDQVLLLAYGGSHSFLAKDSVGVQGNCIYFVDDLCYPFYNKDPKDPLLSRVSGVYYLEDGRIERSFPSVNLPLKPRMSCFTPAL